MKKLGVTLALITLMPATAMPQAISVGSPFEEYVRVLELLGKAAPGSVMVRPYPVGLNRMLSDTAQHPWRVWMEGGSPPARAVSPEVTLDPARLRMFVNSTTPFGGNDGAVWQGKGLTTALDAGVSMEWGPLSVSLHPELIYTQNASFALAPVNREGASQYAYPWWQIDLPQKFGPGAFWTLDAGETSLRIRWRGAAAGFGTGALWWGPGIDNAIIMSNNAPGFPHAFLATSRPVDVGIGMLDGQWIWGRLEASTWADSLPQGWYESNGVTNRRFLTGIVGSLRLRGLTGWTIGGARVYTLMEPRAGLGAGDYLLVVQRLTKNAFATKADPAGNDARDQILSLFARWARPGSGFEAYAEWSRNDHAWDLTDFILEPDHSQGYVLGFQQALPLSKNRILTIRSEATHLAHSTTSELRAYPTYYVHSQVLPGYTQRGQVIGAAVGPGGNEQTFAVDLFTPRGRAGVFLLRQVRDNDAYSVVAARDSLGPLRHDVWTGVGARASGFFGPMILGADARLTKEYNRDFTNSTTYNFNLGMSAQWRGLQRRPLAP